MSRSVKQDYEKLRKLPSRTQENIDAACHHCGESGRMKGMATRDNERRLFCHTPEKSCWNERRGTYFEEVVPKAASLEEAGAEVISILTGLIPKITAGLAKREEGGQKAA